MKRLFEHLVGSAPLAACIISLLSPQKTWAYAFVYHFDIGGDPVFSGTPPDGAAPWLNVVVQDITPGTIRLSVLNLLIGPEKLSELYLNLNTSLDPTSLNFTAVANSDGFSLPTIDQGLNAFQAGGGGRYDLRLNFSQSAAAAFTAGEYVIYDVTGITGLTATDFLFPGQSAGGHGPFLAAAHIQAIMSSGADDSTSSSGWIAPSEATPYTIPEPNALSLIFLPVSAWIWRRFRRNQIA